jgi:ferredoxin-NADP reductase/DMSO/TMAO reductase YedYZ heme-binding membrane subunit
MVTPGRSSEGRYPGDRDPDGPVAGGGQPAGASAPARPGPSWPGSAPGTPPAGPALPPPEWADRPMGHHWTSSWQAHSAAAQPTVPPWENVAGLRATAANPALRATAGQPAVASPAWPGPGHGTGTRPGPAGAPGSPPPDSTTRAASARGQTQSVGTSGPLRASAPLRTSGSLRTSGALRAARPMTPGTGRARIVAPVAVLTVIGLGLAGVLFLWWRSTLFQHSPGAVLTDIGEVLGLLAGYGFVVLVALMARLPPLERSIGTDRLARWHATGGRYLISTVTGHVAFIITGYALTARKNVVSETATLLTTFPDVLMAAAAWLLLLGIAAFSMRAARRRMAYETWYYAHLYTYLAIALAFSHQFANGGTFAESFPARVTWSALYALVGGLLLWYRVLTPLWNAGRHQFTVQSVRPEAPGIVSVFISGRDFDRLRAEPGQFFRWRFLTRDRWWQSHPYSLSAMPQPNLMRITVKSRGDHSGSLARLAPGTRILAEGPYGAFTPSLTGRRMLFIAGGVGITPIRAMFAALPKRMSGGITLLYRASHPRDVVFSRELNAIASDRQAALHYLVGSRAELGFDPLDAAHLQQTVPGLHRYEAYVCGPSGMTQAAVSALVAAGVPRRRIHHESFDF